SSLAFVTAIDGGCAVADGGATSIETRMPSSTLLVVVIAGCSLQHRAPSTWNMRAPHPTATAMVTTMITTLCNIRLPPLLQTSRVSIATVATVSL
ncbi:MAG: hypothetical protein DMF90_19925, partial [Acidobacteria bacterium]